MDIETKLKLVVKRVWHLNYWIHIRFVEYFGYIAWIGKNGSDRVIGEVWGDTEQEAVERAEDWLNFCYIGLNM